MPDGTRRTTLTGHTGAIGAARFLSEQLLISASVDYTLRLWSVERAKPYAVLGGDGPLHKLVITADTTHAVVTEFSGRMHRPPGNTESSRNHILAS